MTHIDPHRLNNLQPTNLLSSRMSHRAVFTLLLFAGFSLPCTHAGMSGLHTYTRALSKCLDSPRVSAGGGSLGGARFLCALTHVRGPFLVPSDQRKELCFMQLSRVINEPQNAEALRYARHLCLRIVFPRRHNISQHTSAGERIVSS